MTLNRRTQQWWTESSNKWMQLTRAAPVEPLRLIHVLADIDRASEERACTTLRTPALPVENPSSVRWHRRDQSRPSFQTTSA